MTATTAVDWDVARRRSAALAHPGPRIDREQALALVESLRSAAVRAPQIVAGVTELEVAGATAGRLPVYVVDRPRWAQANIDMFEHLVVDALPAPSTPFGARIAGEELGVLLSLLASRVLGQFDPFTGPRLLLVAPNIAHIQSELRVNAADFHLWVCLHEQTHAVQFCAAPWLAEYLNEAMSAIAGTVTDESEVARRLSAAVQALPKILSGEGVTATSGGPLVSALLGQAEQERLQQVLAVMSLLEGHADIVMDAAGPQVIPSVRRIRSAFEARRDNRSPLDILLRRLLGLDAKLAQYREGAAFVRGVVGAVGHVGLNAVWTDAQLLPTPAEIGDPGAWVRRVHG